MLRNSFGTTKQNIHQLILTQSNDGYTIGRKKGYTYIQKLKLPCYLLTHHVNGFEYTDCIVFPNIDKNLTTEEKIKYVTFHSHLSFDVIDVQSYTHYSTKSHEALFIRIVPSSLKQTKNNYNNCNNVFNEQTNFKKDTPEYRLSVVIWCSCSNKPSSIDKSRWMDMNKGFAHLQEVLEQELDTYVKLKRERTKSKDTHEYKQTLKNDCIKDTHHHDIINKTDDEINENILSILGHDIDKNDNVIYENIDNICEKIGLNCLLSQ